MRKAQVNRVTEARLFDFLVRQRQRFNPQDWIDLDYPDRAELAACALFLAAVEWYGDRAGLAQVAERLHPGFTGRFAELARSTGFDCSRFSSMLRRRLELGDEPRIS